MNFKKITSAVLIAAVVICAAVSSCRSNDESAQNVSGTEASASSSYETINSDDADNESEQVNDLPYTIKVSRTFSQIFEGAGYDYGYAGTMQSGTYTIVEEARDDEGNLWGKLRSGVGWVNIDDAAENAEQPLAAAYAEENLLDDVSYEEFSSDESESSTKLIFRSNEAITDVKFSLLEIGNDGQYEVASELYALSELTSDDAFVASVAFYGDMTAYGVSFTDADGQARNYAASISGRNGSLTWEEY